MHFTWLSRHASQFFMLVIVLRATTSGDAADTLTNAVPGLQPTSATLQQVVALYHKAVEAAYTPAYSQEWSITTSGLHGTEILLRNGRNWWENETLGPFTTLYGRKDGQDWFQNENGYTVLVHDAHHMYGVSNGAVASAIAGDIEPGVTLLGEVDSPIAAYVVDVNPPQGRHEHLFIDKTTGDLIRREEFSYGQRFVTTYDDFRETQGVRAAWHVRYTDGHPENDDDEQMVSFSIGAPQATHAFDIPTDRRVVVEFPAGQHVVTLPVTIDEYGRIIVHASIAGRGVDFQLDSGASSIVLDDQVAKQLGLPTYGTSIETTAGSYTAHRVVIPEVRIGDLRMHNIVADTFPFTDQEDEATKIVGLLGFDFIADTVLHVDYYHHKVDAIDPGFFTAPATARMLTIDLDDRVPFAPGSIGGVTGSHFIIDTGADLTTVFSSFAATHPDAVRDTGLGKTIRMGTEFDPEADAVGGTFTEQPAEVSSFQVGSLNFTNWLLMVGHTPASYNDTDEIGLVGADFLSLFDVWFDYSNSAIYLDPNDTFRKYFRINQ